MGYDRNTIHSLYRKLLNFYPRKFREQLGESMAQTFNDLYQERKRQTGIQLVGFVMWMFLETVIGIVGQHILLTKEMNPMKNIFTSPRSAAITSLFLSLPLGLTFVTFIFDIGPLEKLLNELFTMEGQQGELNMLGRIVIFGGLLLLPLALALNLQPLLKGERAEGTKRFRLMNLIVGALISVLILLTWGGLILEEIYCLQGIRCD